MNRERTEQEARDTFEYLDERAREALTEDRDTITWLNENALEIDQHDILLATGGPAYGVSLVHGTPVYWYQNWFTEKTCQQADEVEWWSRLFDLVRELG